MYEPEYYHSFFPDASAASAKTKTDEVPDGRIGKHWDEYNSGRGADLVDVDVGYGLQAGRDEQARLESTKKPKTGDDFEYKVRPYSWLPRRYLRGCRQWMNEKGQSTDDLPQTIGKTKGLAAQRHQLTSLLSSAYSQKEEVSAAKSCNVTVTGGRLLTLIRSVGRSHCSKPEEHASREAEIW